MTWAGLYPWLLVLHVLCVFAFLAIHGVSMGVWWRVRRERDRAKLVGAARPVGRIHHPDDASRPAGPIVSGILVGVAAAWWFNGQWWLWAVARAARR